MEVLLNDKLIKYNDDTLQVVRKTFDLDKPGAMKVAVDILEEWVKQQNHFTKKDFDRRYLENTIIVSKGSIERAKSRLDRSCTLRTLMPQCFGIYDIKHFFETDLKDIKHAILPKMTKNHERIYILRNTGTSKFESSFVESYARAIPTMCEYLRLHDYALTNFFVLDYMDVSLSELAKVLKISAIQEIEALLMECYGFRLKALYIISPSKLIDLIVTIFKQAMSAKLSERVYVVKDRTSLRNMIEEDVLPEEYGGKEKSLDELHGQWLDVLYSEDHIEYFKEISTAKTNENMRPKDKFNEQYMGMPGTFRTLNVD